MKKIVVLLMIFGSLAGCDQVAEREITAFELQQQLREIQDLISAGECSEGSQCSFIAYGSKPCGGPRGYFIFSSDIDVERLKDKVEKYTEEERLYNKQKGGASDCMFVTPPNNVGCIDGKCVEITN